MESLVEKSVYILRETHAQFTNPCVLWSTGKDSTTVLSLIREAFMGTIPYPVIHMDTGYKFPEIYEFRDRIAKEWNLNLIIMKPDTDAAPEKGRLKCCTERKTKVLKKVIHDYEFDAVIVSIRRDEHGIRGKERFMSPRDKQFRWRYWTPHGGESGTALQDVEMSGWGLFESDFGIDCDHVRVHPILHWTEDQVWKYIESRNLPFSSLYRADYVEKFYGLKGKRYRSLGCMPCTLPVDSNASTIKEIIRNVELKIGQERAGRAQDKEKAYAMQSLRSLGYL